MEELQVAHAVAEARQYPELQLNQAIAVQLHVEHYEIFEQTKQELEFAR